MAQMSGRLLSHPAVWCVPAMALLACIAMTFNDRFYLDVVNYDPQGDDQQWEWAHATRVFRYTSGVLCGQFLAVVAGVLLARRHRHVVALAVAVPLGALLAAVTLAVAVPLTRAAEGGRSAAVGPDLVRLLGYELGAYPLLAAAGVGLGVILARTPADRPWRRLLLPALVTAWWIGVVVGLLQDDTFGAPRWMLAWPPVAASAAIALAGLSRDVWDAAGVDGDWGRGASTALLAGCVAYALLLNLAGVWLSRRRGSGHRDSVRSFHRRE